MRDAAVSRIMSSHASSSSSANFSGNNSHTVMCTDYLAAGAQWLIDSGASRHMTGSIRELFGRHTQTVNLANWMDSGFLKPSYSFIIIACPLKSHGPSNIALFQSAKHPNCDVKRFPLTLLRTTGLARFHDARMSPYSTLRLKVLGV